MRRRRPRRHPGASEARGKWAKGGGTAAAAATEGQGIERAVGGGSASQPRLLLLFLLLLQTRRVQPQRSPSRRSTGGTGGSRAARSWAGSPAAMDSDDEMVEEAVEGTSISLGPGVEAPGLGTRKEWRVTRAAPGPTAATVPYVGGPLAGSVRGKQPPPRAAGSAHCAVGRRPGTGSAGPGSRESTAAPSRPPASCPRSCEPCSALRPSPLRGRKVGVRKRTALSDPRSPRSSAPPGLATPSPSPAASPFLPLAAASRPRRPRPRPGGSPAQRTGPNLARGSRDRAGCSSEKMKSL